MVIKVYPISTVVPIEVKSGKTYKRHNALKEVAEILRDACERSGYLLF